MFQSHVKADILTEKRRELSSYLAQADSAVSLLTNTIDDLEDINQAIDERVGEIETYQRDLEATKAGLLSAREKNTGVISNFRAVLGQG